MPALDLGLTASFSVFSNHNFGSREKTLIHSVSEKLDRFRYNTSLIDTRVEYKGREFFVCLRATCYGQRCSTIAVRARDATEGNPNVHLRDIPRDADLLNYVYSRCVTPKISELIALCEEVGKILGPGFYSHDILPCAKTGRLFLCETGIKFHNPGLSDLLGEDKDKLFNAADSLGMDIDKIAHVFASELIVMPEYRSFIDGRL